MNEERISILKDTKVYNSKCKLTGESMTEFLSTQELGAKLRISPTTLRRLRKAKRGPLYFRVGRLIRYRSFDVDDWAERQQRRPDIGQTKSDVLSSEDPLKALF